ncbi:MAG: vWA domain-containing protein, partial [Myxococcota bacterium]
APLALLVPFVARAGPTLTVDPPPRTTVAPVQRAQVELVFVIDTTGSMSGLIEGAKETIWSVVNDFASQQPRPDVRVGIVAYRDRGDHYVTSALPLTSDLDGVYARLVSLRAQGGNDTPESVVRALEVAVGEQPWTRQGRVFRSIFLVGDAPDKHYADEPSAGEVVSRARGSGIYVNAIQCGSITGTASEFQAIAKKGEGTFRAVAQDGAVERLATPQDPQLDALRQQLQRTALPWGSAAEQAQTSQKLQMYDDASLGTNASRLSVLSKSGGKIVTGEGRGDLIDELQEGRVVLSQIPEDQLPEALRKLSAAERVLEVDRRIAERKRLQAEIVGVVEDRDAWVTEARRKAKAAPAYDREVVESSLERMTELGYIR